MTTIGMTESTLDLLDMDRTAAVLIDELRPDRLDQLVTRLLGQLGIERCVTCGTIRQAPPFYGCTECGH